MNADPSLPSAPLIVFDPIAMIRVLNAHGVRYVVIGGIAAGVQGAVWATADLDICYARTRRDLQRLAEALGDLAARPIGLADGVTVRLDARSLQLGDIWTLDTRFGRLDLIGVPAPGIEFDFLDRSARRIESDEAYLVASFDDLITMKREAGRAKDRAHIDLLEAARDELARVAADKEKGPA